MQVPSTQRTSGGRCTFSLVYRLPFASPLDRSVGRIRLCFGRQPCTHGLLGSLWPIVPIGYTRVYSVTHRARVLQLAAPGRGCGSGACEPTDAPQRHGTSLSRRATPSHATPSASHALDRDGLPLQPPVWPFALLCRAMPCGTQSLQSPQHRWLQSTLVAKPWGCCWLHRMHTLSSSRRPIRRTRGRPELRRCDAAISHLAAAAWLSPPTSRHCRMRRALTNTNTSACSLLSHCRNASPIAFRCTAVTAVTAQIGVGTAERVRALGAASAQEDDARPCSLLDPDLHHTFDELYACDRSALLVSIAQTIVPQCTALHCQHSSAPLHLRTVASGAVRCGTAFVDE